MGRVNDMRYFILSDGAALRRFGGRALEEPYPCGTCRRMVRLGETDLKVGFGTSPPHPDALAVLFGPELVVSDALRSMIDSMAPPGVRYARVRNRKSRDLPYWQIIVNNHLRVGEGSITGGTGCDECGGFVQLELEPLFLRRIPDEGPVIATLLESKYICLVREDLAAAIRAAGLDVDLVPTYYDGESLPDPGPTFPGQNQDWSDL